MHEDEEPSHYTPDPSLQQLREEIAAGLRELELLVAELRSYEDDPDDGMELTP